MNKPSSLSIPRYYCWLLITLLFLFCLRVLGQILVAFSGVTFLPPMEEWMSGLLPYPGLLTSQILIILLFGKICLDFARGYGYFVTPRPQLGINLLKFGWLYLGVMIIRYVIRMGLYPHERWTGGSIPIFFHWVLASFLLVLGRYHWRSTAQTRVSGLKPRTPATKVLFWSQVAVGGLGIVLWVFYLLAPSLLAHRVGLRHAQFAVRVQKHAIMTTTDGTQLSSEIFHPWRTVRTPTILVRTPPSKTLKDSLFVSFVGRMWAERGYTVVIQGTRGGRSDPLQGERQDGIETLSWISKQPWFNGQVYTTSVLQHDIEVTGLPTL